MLYCKQANFLFFMSNDNNCNQYAYTHLGALIRIDVSLKNNIPEFSRTFLSEILKSGLITVNAIIITKGSFKVKDGNKIVVTIPKPATLTTNALPLEIIDEQADFLIINKPAGILTHPAPSCKNVLSIAEMIANKLIFPTDHPHANRAGIVHRLDKDTSGLLIVAKNMEAQNHLADIFQNHKIVKKYLAVVDGIPTRNEFVIDKPIGRDPSNPSKMRLFGIAAKPAYSKAKVLKTGNELALLEVTITTGRTHQIRVHLASLGCPVVGDSVYGKPSPLIHRQALHAFFLAFSYKGQEFLYQSPLPTEMNILPN